MTSLILVVSVAAECFAAPGTGRDPKRADALSRQALEAYYAARYDDAARLYHAAFTHDPTRAQLLYGAARSEHRARRFDDAERDYRRAQALAAPGSPYRVKAQHHLARLASDRRRAPPLVDGAARRRWGWGGAIAGGGLLVGAGALLAVALSDQAQLDAQLAETQGGRISGVTYSDAAARQSLINRRLVLGQVLGGVGLAALGLGAWWIWTAPERRLSLQLSPRGATWLVRF